MAKRATVSLELLQRLMERLLAEQREVKTGLEQVKTGLEQVQSRLARVERALLAGQRLLLDRSTAETEIQHQLDAAVRRIEALEAK